jgi:hypothetical protein
MVCSYKGLKHRGDPSSYITSLNTIENGMGRISSAVRGCLLTLLRIVSERDKARVSFPDYVTAMRQMDVSSSPVAERQRPANGEDASSPSKPQRTAPPYLQPYLRSFDLQKCPALAGMLFHETDSLLRSVTAQVHSDRIFGKTCICSKYLFCGASGALSLP